MIPAWLSPDLVHTALLGPVGSDSHLGSCAAWCHHAATSGFTFHANVTTPTHPSVCFSSSSNPCDFILSFMQNIKACRKFKVTVFISRGACRVLYSGLNTDKDQIQSGTPWPSLASTLCFRDLMWSGVLRSAFKWFVVH